MLAAGREGMCVCRERVYERVCVGVKVAGRCAYMSRFFFFLIGSLLINTLFVHNAGSPMIHMIHD